MPSFNLTHFLEKLNIYIEKRTGRKAEEHLGLPIGQVRPHVVEAAAVAAASAEVDTCVTSSIDSSSENETICSAVSGDSLSSNSSSESQCRVSPTILAEAKEDAVSFASLCSKSSVLYNKHLTSAKVLIALNLFSQLRDLQQSGFISLLKVLRSIEHAHAKLAVVQQEQQRSFDSQGDLIILLTKAIEQIHEQTESYEAQLEELEGVLTSLIDAWFVTLERALLKIWECPETAKYRDSVIQFLVEKMRRKFPAPDDIAGIWTRVVIAKQGSTVDSGVDVKLAKMLNSEDFAALQVVSDILLKNLALYERLQLASVAEAKVRPATRAQL